MENTNLLNLPDRKTYLEPGQIVFIGVVAIALSAFVVLRPPQFIKSVFKDDVKVSSKYYAYVEPQTGSQVASASTTTEGPSILNDDGTFSPAIDSGSVLGIDTDDITPYLNKIRVSTISATAPTIQTYFAQVDAMQESFVNQEDFQAAMTSNNAEQVKMQSQHLDGLIRALLSMVVPQQAERYHKLLVVQYKAGLILMQNYSKIDKNPQLVNEELGIFIQTQQEQNDERRAIEQKYNIE